MKTDDLINMLGRNVEPVASQKLRNTLVIALAFGTAAAFCLMLAIFSMPASASGEHFSLKLLAPAFTLSLVATGTVFLFRSARPGKTRTGSLFLIGAPFLALLSASIVALVLASPAAWSGTLFGPQWVVCLICIPLFAVAPFVSLIWALRKNAPTNLMQTGAITGLVSGALGATVFAIPHPGGSIPFVFIWYGGPIILCTLLGAILGPRLLRW